MSEDRQIATLTGHNPFLLLCKRLENRVNDMEQKVLEADEPEIEIKLFKDWKNAKLWLRSLKRLPEELNEKYLPETEL